MRSNNPFSRWACPARLAVLITLLLCISAGFSIAGTPNPSSKPTTKPTTRPLTPAGQAVQQFHNLLKANQREAAGKLIATSPTPVRDAARRVKRLADAMANPTWDFSVLDGNESGDIAVVLINDYLKDGRKTIDIKPWYLVRQEGQWRLLGKYTDFELAEYGFDKARIEEFRKLETWSERRTPELRREQPDCGC